MNALLLAAAVGLSATPKYLGDGALRLIPGALAQARERWGGDLCLSGLSILVGREVKAVGPGARPGRITTFQFGFKSREDGSLYEAFYSEPEGPAPYDPAGSACRLDTYSELRPGSFKAGCIAGISIDSDDALGVATRHGIDLARYPSPRLHLEHVDRDSSLWKGHKKLRGKTVWLVGDGNYFTRATKPSSRYVVVVDASSGRVLEQGEDRKLPNGDNAFPHFSVSKNLCSEDSGF